MASDTKPDQRSRNRPPAGGSSPQIRIHLMDYDKDTLKESFIDDPEETFPFQHERRTTSWINVDGLKDHATITRLCQGFGVHPLVIEDILNPRQRPKVEDYGDHLFIAVRMLHMNGRRDQISGEQITMILGRSFLITFQERPGDIFDPLRQRIRSGKGRVRNSGADFLAYALLDMVVDNYFVILEDIGGRMELLEEGLLKSPEQRHLPQIHRLKRQMALLRKSVWPMRELLAGLERQSKDRSPLVRKETSIYLRDVYDHTIQLIEALETNRDLVSGILDIYLSSVSHRLNEVMKVLTVIATIFIPLTFITGIYGMNFHSMPELESPLGYPAALGLMALVGLVMVLYFKNKGWV